MNVNVNPGTGGQKPFSGFLKEVKIFFIILRDLKSKILTIK
jgi:hypothetical protein